MAFDDPVVWILIITAVVFLFGGNKIPQLARAMGEARREFDRASRGTPPGEFRKGSSASSNPREVQEDPLIEAAEKEGIDTHAKSREQIASELSSKLQQFASDRTKSF